MYCSIVRKVFPILLLSDAVLTQAGRGCSNGMNILRELAKPPKYDKLIAPCQDGKPIDVGVEIFLVSINNIKASVMELDMQIYFRQYWRDYRLSFDHLNTSMEYIKLSYGFMHEFVWSPDAYFENEKAGYYHNIMKSNELTRIYRNGDVLYSTRLTLTLSCPMDFYDFPMDTQVCNIKFLSYSHSTKEIIYRWVSNTSGASVFSNTLQLPQFSLTNIETISEIYPFTVGNYTILTMSIHLQRRIAFYLIRNYIPAILLVAVSWLSFWVDRKSVPARVGIGITSILTMTTLMIGIGQDDLPVVSYVKAVDWYYFGCFGFVFTALCEYGVVNHLDVAHRKHIEMMRRKAVSSAKKKETKMSGAFDNFGYDSQLFGMDNKQSESEDETDHIYVNVFMVQSPIGDIIEDNTKKIYPLLFLVFNIIYWGAYWKSLSF